MATTVIETQATAQAPRVLGQIGRWIERLAMLSDAARAARDAGYLAELSDEQLANRGLTRDQIVQYAFRHLAAR